MPIPVVSNITGTTVGLAEKESRSLLVYLNANINGNRNATTITHAK